MAIAGKLATRTIHGARRGRSGRADHPVVPTGEGRPGRHADGLRAARSAGTMGCTPPSRTRCSSSWSKSTCSSSRTAAGCRS